MLVLQDFEEEDPVLASSDDRFREMFYEEARELLISLEEGLMDLERRRETARTSTGRSARRTASRARRRWSASATIAEFTHGIEAVLERIRSGGLAVDSDIITTLLESRDHLAAMVEGEAAGVADSRLGRAEPTARRVARGLATASRVRRAASRPRRPRDAAPEPIAACSRRAGRRPPETVEPPAAPSHAAVQAKRARRSGRSEPKPRAAARKPRRRVRAGDAPRPRPATEPSRPDRPDPLPDQAQARPGHPPARRQPAGRARRASRAGQTPGRHRYRTRSRRSTSSTPSGAT